MDILRGTAGADLNLPGILLVIALIGLSSGSKKRKRAAGAAQQKKPDAKAMTAKKMREEAKDLNGKIHGKGHTHDRLDYDCFNPNESEAEHYKRQLDGFLQAGIIEKAEYKELWRKYTERKQTV